MAGGIAGTGKETCRRKKNTPELGDANRKNGTTGQKDIERDTLAKAASSAFMGREVQFLLVKHPGGGDSSTFSVPDHSKKKVEIRARNF